MKKLFILSTAIMTSAMAQAGGLLTNSNQNAAFLRNFAQEGQITLTSLYANPAGNAFLSPGWHVSLNSQSAFQQRNITTTFPLFKANTSMEGYGTADANDTHTYHGKAKAPVIPSFTVSHNWDKWSLSAHFALNGGGGKCEFDEGLGSFESLYSSTIAKQLPGIVNNAVNTQMTAALPGIVANNLKANGVPEPYNNLLAASGTYNVNTSSQMTGYSLDSYMKGRSYYFGLQVGGAYKIKDNLSAYIGIRGIYATCNYNGYVQDVKASYAYSANYSYDVPANAQIGFPGKQGDGTQPGSGTQDLNDYSLSMNCDQTGFGITPIFGIDWEINKQWNVAIKYEANTRMSLKNKTEMNAFAKSQAEQDGNVLSEFKDGDKVRADIPAILAVGGEYRPIDKVRVDASAKMYFDKTARKQNNKEDLINHNTWEVALGAEYDCCKLITVSASWQSTNYGLSDAYMNDLSFNNSNNSIGFGIRIHPTKLFNIDLGYMHTFYKDRTVTTATAIGNKVDVYSRKNEVFGIGFNFAM